MALRGRLRAAALMGFASFSLASEAALASFCWPPVFEQGLRLHQRFDLRTTWLWPSFLQHEVCWREPERPGEQRVFLVGNSGIFGFPLPPDRAYWGLLNRRASDRELPVHFYNLGYVFSYQLKDALILRHALAYAPDVIVYGITFDDMRHLAPNPYPPLVQFFDGNSLAVAALADESPPGLAEPFEIYRQAQRGLRRRARFDQLRQAGRFLLQSIDVGAEALRNAHFLAEDQIPPDRVPPEHARQMKRRRRYDCKKARQKFEEHFRDWKQWNILAYLDQIRRETSAEVVILNWPVAHEPRGRCYNVRYTESALADYNRWLREQTHSRGFPYLDYHDLLAPEAFLDSLHPTEQGHRTIADQLERDLLPLLGERAIAGR